MSDTPPAEAEAPEAETEASVSEADSTEQAYGVPAVHGGDMLVLHPSRSKLVAVADAMAGDGYVSCVDLTAVDYLAHPGRSDLPEGVVAERFEVVVTLISHSDAHRVRLRVQVPADDPVVPTLFDVYPGTEALEREVADLFGIAFAGHPDPTRIIMPPDWEGHPLRKDYEVGRIPVQFKGTR